MRKDQISKHHAFLSFTLLCFLSRLEDLPQPTPTSSFPDLLSHSLMKEECLESKLQQTSNRTSGLRIRNRQQRRSEAKETRVRARRKKKLSWPLPEMLETRVKPGVCPGEALVDRHKTNVYHAVCDKRMLLFEEGHISDTQRDKYFNKLKAHQREI